MTDFLEETQNDELKKYTGIASDMQMDAKLRSQAIDLIGNIRTHEALLALLSLAANEKLGFNERDLSLKKARDIIKASR